MIIRSKVYIFTVMLLLISDMLWADTLTVTGSAEVCISGAVLNSNGNIVTSAGDIVNLSGDGINVSTLNDVLKITGDSVSLDGIIGDFSISGDVLIASSNLSGTINLSDVGTELDGVVIGRGGVLPMEQSLSVKLVPAKSLWVL